MNFCKRLLLVVLVLLLIIGVTPIITSAESSSYKVTTAVLNVRSGPNTTYSTIGKVTLGQVLTVTEISNNWGKISYNGSTGWICLDYAMSLGTKQFTISATGLAMIKKFEGFSPTKYWDGSHYTIGYGTTCGADDYPNGITEAQASALLVEALASYENNLDAFLHTYKIKVSQKQYDALVSFTFNYGNPWVRWDTFSLKTILINGVHKYTPDAIKAAFGEFVKSGGAVLPGLVSRRNTEASLFIEGSNFGTTGSFNDVYSIFWYYNAVEYVNQKGIMTGTEKRVFKPGMSLNRAMMVTILAKINKADISAYKGDSTFVDVASSSWYTPYVKWAYEKGVAKGIGNNRFAPEHLISRQDMVVMLYNYTNMIGYNTTVSDTSVINKFTDKGKIANYAVTAMTWAVNNKCIKGNDNKELNPLNKASRAEAAQFMKNYCEVVLKW